MPTDLLLGEDPSPHLQMAVSLLCPPMVEGREGEGRGGWGEREKALLSFRKGTDPIHRCHPQDLIASQRPQVQIPSHGGLGFQHGFWGDTNVQSIAEGQDNSISTVHLDRKDLLKMRTLEVNVAAPWVSEEEQSCGGPSRCKGPEVGIGSVCVEQERSQWIRERE